ncbi:hypothetical protein EDB81DRAFT_63216 [Dactylonectria macrodidyma]|uniref:Uncharacterized protein n=1 Tax=Dactylonectria macrodidyma TaxID=307937 RepID=A0A9P9J2D0_9HYPO|nr:hypothetical protein EDB81DRAFT_63216 [Dactylonectria macrodidyma]
MEDPVVNTIRARWQMDARHAGGMALPPWTRDESDNEDHDAATRNDMARRNRRKIKRRDKQELDGGQASPMNPNTQQLPPSSPNPDLRKRQTESSDIPGNSLRESTADTHSHTTETAYPTSSGYPSSSRYPSSSIYPTRSTTERTATEMATSTAAPTATGATNAPKETAGYSSASETAGDSDTPSESDYESSKETTTSSVPSASASASASAGLSLGGTAEAELLEAPNDVLHNNVHKIMLVAGSVVGFILIVGVCLIAWKVHRRARHRKAPLDDMSFHKPSRIDKILAKVPFIRTRLPNREWYTIEDPTKFGFEKSNASKPPRFASRRIESQFFAPVKPVGVYSSPRIKSLRSKFGFGDTVSPTSTVFVERTAVQAQVVSSQTAKEIRLSAQDKSVPTTPRYTYSLSKRQTGVSELSSISSGFGDGDIIITADNTVSTVRTGTIPSIPEAVADPSQQSSRRSNAASSVRSYGGESRQSSVRGDSRRDTTLTEVSLDGRPRFRSVNSWVTQQSGHLRRAQRGVDGDAPPVPMLPPPDQEFRLMMPDGEEPRRVDMR